MLDRLRFPQPWLSLILFVTWQLLSDHISAGTLVLGFVLSWAIPQMTEGFWPGTGRRLSNPGGCPATCYGY